MCIVLVADNLNEFAVSQFVSIYPEQKKRIMDDDLTLRRNVVIIGETGVGRSTLINCFPNYARFPTFESAFEGSTIQITDGKCETPNAYEITCNDVKLNFIDTPGITGSEGSREQDKHNIKKITNFFSKFAELHAICILIKSTTSILTDNFKNMMNYLLMNLHKSADSNIIFCYTHVSDFDNLLNFPPRDALKEYFIQAGIYLDLTDTNQYYFNNLGYRQLVQRNSRLQVTLSLNHYWQNSAAEAIRLLKHVKHVSPYMAEKTEAINRADSLLNVLAKVIFEADEHLGDGIDLKGGFLELPVVRLETSHQTCKQCVVTKSMKRGGGEIEYSIHKRCSIEAESRFRFVIRFLCWFNIFSWCRKCPVCKCSAFYHIVSDIEVKVDRKIDTATLKCERLEILKYCAKLSRFLQIHSFSSIRMDRTYNERQKNDIFIQKLFAIAPKLTDGVFLWRKCFAYFCCFVWRFFFLWRCCCKPYYQIAVLDTYKEISSQREHVHALSLAEIEIVKTKLYRFEISGQIIKYLMTIQENQT